jgi:predicted nucleic acid-binding protein
MKPRIYIETTVLSYLAARPSRDVVSLSRQKLSHDFWEWATTAYELCSSDLVRDEISKGDAAASLRRASFFEQCHILPQDERTATLAQQLIAAKAVPATEPEDAAHIATATLAQMKYIVSWNLAHMVSPQAKRQLEQAITQLGYTPPLLATPEEIFEAESP